MEYDEVFKLIDKENNPIKRKQLIQQYYDKEWNDFKNKYPKVVDWMIEIEEEK